jgi:hypothetical protein
VFAAALAGVPAHEALRERADAIHKTGRGIDRKTADEFWKVLNEGQVWTGERADRPATVGQTTKTDRLSYGEFIIIPAPWTPALVSPLMTKLYEESNLRLAPNSIAIHPDDARDCGAHAVL